jgi:hypothetical protein
MKRVGVGSDQGGGSWEQKRHIGAGGGARASVVKD